MTLGRQRSSVYGFAVLQRSVTPLYRGFFGFVTLAAITTQLVAASGTPTFSPVNYFSYFTIDSNLIAAGAWSRAARHTPASRG